MRVAEWVVIVIAIGVAIGAIVAPLRIAGQIRKMGKSGRVDKADGGVEEKPDDRQNDK